MKDKKLCRLYYGFFYFFFINAFLYICLILRPAAINYVCFVNRQDSGNYICQASNGVSRPAQAVISVRVKCEFL